MGRLARITILAILALLAGGGAANAQLQIAGGFDPYLAEGVRDPDTALKFNLSTPGARSLAMGGAFVGLADDATAAYTNPAGLTNLALGGSEVAIEVRQARFTTSFTDRGHYPTNAGYPTFVSGIGLDSVDLLPPSESEREATGLSFLSFGYVLPGGLTAAVYRHELADFQSAFESQGPFNDDGCRDANGVLLQAPDDAPELVDRCFLFRVLPRRTSADLQIVNYGASAAYGFSPGAKQGVHGALSLGLGISYYQMDFAGSTETFDLCRQAGGCADDLNNRLPGGFFGSADFSLENRRSATTEIGEDQALGFSVGLLWKLGRQQRWSVGGVFRKGPEFETQKRTFIRGFPEFGDAGGRVTVPDVYGVGLAYRNAGGSTKLTLDVNEVRYSQTLQDFASVFCLELGFDAENNLECIDEFEFGNDFEIPDVTQVHIGFERIVLVVESLFVGTLRFGAWLEPFHAPEYVGFNPDLLAILERPTDDETHFSLGLGLVIKEDYQIDLAIDHSDPVSTVSLSLVTFL